MFERVFVCSRQQDLILLLILLLLVIALHPHGSLSVLCILERNFCAKMLCMINFSGTAGPGILSGFESLGNAKADCYIISVLPVIHW